MDWQSQLSPRQPRGMIDSPDARVSNEVATPGRTGDLARTRAKPIAVVWGVVTFSLMAMLVLAQVPRIGEASAATETDLGASTAAGSTRPSATMSHEVGAVQVQGENEVTAGTTTHAGALTDDPGVPGPARSSDLQKEAAGASSVATPAAVGAPVVGVTVGPAASPSGSASTAPSSAPSRAANGAVPTVAVAPAAAAAAAPATAAAATAEANGKAKAARNTGKDPAATQAPALATAVPTAPPATGIKAAKTKESTGKAER